MKRLILDPGHGGIQPGAIGLYGLRECDVNLCVANKILHNMIDEDGLQIILTRIGDETKSLTERAYMANEFGADLFVSLHCNAAKATEANGMEIFTSPGDTGADPIASVIFSSMTSYFPELRIRKDMQDGDVDKEERFTVLTKTLMPAVLIEMAFISNFSEEILLGSDRWQSRMANAITEGILESINIV